MKYTLNEKQTELVVSILNSLVEGFCEKHPDEYDFDDTMLNLEAYHVAEDDIALDRRRTDTHIVLYVLWKGNSDNSLHQPSYVPIFDYGVIDNCGDWYVCNYPPD